jgi:hypothetical protein
MNLDELEAAVRVAWDREAIAIYADHLQTIGDPRGELVAIDLRIDEGEADAAVTTRREQLIAEWFGADLPPGIVRYGFVDVRASGMRPDSQLTIALRGPGAKYIRSVELAGPRDELLPAIHMLVKEPRPWLTKLVIHQWQDDDTPTLSKDFAVALPALDSLELSGRNILAFGAHPNVQRLRITGYDAHFALLDPSAIWPRVTALDFAFQCQYATAARAPSRYELDRLVRGFPALRELDLSRNDRGSIEPHSLGGAIVLGDFLPRFASVEVLRLPKRQRDDARLQNSLDALTSLRELEIYDTPTHEMPTHDRATIRALKR